MQTMDDTATATPQHRLQCHDADDNSTMQTRSNDADNDNGDDNADNDADINTDNSATTQMRDDDADDNAREVKTIGGTSEAKMGRGGGCWGRRGGHWGRQEGLE
jgi:hypothetical protein